nr:uncharacterized protein LOC119168727 [Rhipicephalus microplus]
MQNGEQRQQASGPVTTLLPPPKALDTTGDVWRSWKTWRQEFELFATATYLNQQPKEVQAATFLMIIGEDARKTYSTLDFATDEEKSDVEVLKMKFEAFYKPALNLAYHEFRFGKCDQKDGESFNDWLTDLRLDTGATCSVIARSQLQKITNKQPLDCNVVLNTFFGFQKKATKQVRLEVATRESKILTEFFVVDDEIAVTLSGTVAEELGLLQRVCSVDQIELYGTAKPYEDVFEGLGQLEGIVYHLKLKPGSQGVVKPARRIPIALQSKVKAELDRMETAGVIVKVTEPTEWASNMVVVTKGEKESVRYLGHILTRDGLSLDPQRLEDILQVQTPSNQKELQTFLGMVSDRRLSQVLQETDQDPVMVKLRQYASSQWPESKADVSSELRCYWSFRDELHTQDGLVFRSNRLIIPAKMRSEVLACLHAAHGGAEKMKARARAVLFWPSINSDLEEVARRCETCQKHKPRNRRLPLMNHEIPSLPWEVVGADICYHNATEYLVVVDFYSFFFEIRPVKTTADKVIAAFADIFATHGFPQRLCTDNGPPFSSQTFVNLSRLMGRNARTLLPVTETHLRPQTIPPEEVQRRLHVIRSRQRSYYNRGTRPLPGLPEGSSVTVYNVPSKTWSPATVIKPANSPRAYIVETEDGLQLQRTREHLRLAPTPLVPPTQEHQADVGPAEPQLRRSERNRRPPQRYPMPEL